MAYLDHVTHFSSDNRTQNPKMLLIFPPRITSSESTVQVFSENNLLVCGVLRSGIGVVTVRFAETTAITFNKKKKKKKNLRTVGEIWDRWLSS